MDVLIPEIQPYLDEIVNSFSYVYLIILHKTQLTHPASS